MNERGRVVGRRDREREGWRAGREWEMNERGRVVGRRDREREGWRAGGWEGGKGVGSE